MKALPDKRLYYSLAFGTGIFLFLLTHLYDILFHYDFRTPLLSARIAISVWFLFVIILFLRIDQKWFDYLAAFSALLASVTVTLLAVITGDGFTSPVYAGHFLVIMAFSLLFQLKNTLFTTALTLMLVQHFVILSFVPSQPKFIILHLLVLISCALLGGVTHHIIYTLFVRNRELETFLPICANCKSIRDDQGYWQKVEKYIEEQQQTSITHSICDPCARELYGEEIFQKAKTSLLSN
ncbi:MAG: hypothetical protein D6B25_18675 [Desulfobulbaceae bacterium]|nr:MAG: hypothetical protein D6B25_18675 [Desulfobulbaceae bacterium]